MKVLQVNCVYKKGSTGKITYDLHQELMSFNIESVVCYGRGELVREDRVYKTCPEWYSRINNAWSRCTGIMYGGCAFSTNNLISIIKKEKPDIVHLQCINGYFVNIYKLITWLKENRIKTVLTLHAEFMFTANCGYSLECEKWKTGCGNCSRKKQETGTLFIDGTEKSWKRMKEAFDGFDELIVASVSPWLMKRAEESPILQGKRHCTVYNGLDTSVFHTYDIEQSDRKIVFHASPAFTDDPNHMKGGYYVVDLAKRMPDVNFVVAGSYSVKGSIPSNVKLLGRVSNQEELAKLYAAASVSLLTSKRETFSMICAESLCCGTPVVGFKAGAPEQISLPQYSDFVEYGDMEGMETAVRKWMTGTKSETIAKEAAAVYDKKVMVQRYMELYKKLEEE